ncbi:TNR6 factor, partial [Eurystomus gularis]|nr:TNR6 factor [Eurystomus gularis]
LGGQCCKKCERGFVKTVDCPTDNRKDCIPCEKGKEYIDHVNEADKCLRCSSCDSIFGLEVAKNCTPEQNTNCTCVKNHFCSSVPCTHCDACTICESGIIEKQCTSTSDTVCGIKECVAILQFLTFMSCFQCSNRNRNAMVGHCFDNCVTTSWSTSWSNSLVIFSCLVRDVDLSSHVAAIVEEMTLQDVKTFVRNHKVPEPIIDQTLRDYCNDTSEQKIKLFQVWYQRHGLKGAYGTLISSLREFKMCTAADKIEQKLKAAISSCQEGVQSYNDDTEQSKTCTEQGRDSYNNSAELSKTCSGNLD